MKRRFLFALTTFVLALACQSATSQEKKPFHFAHRGGSYEFEENTLFAFQSSYDKGIRGFETDVRMTRDGALVILHDNSLDRTHQGEGPVESQDSSKLRDIKTKQRGEPLLFLDDLLAFFSDKPGVYVEFEMKTSSKELYPDERIDEYVRKLHAAVTAKIPEGSTYVFTSFDERPLRAMRALDPKADLLYIKGGPVSDEVIATAKSIGVQRIGCKMEGTTRLMVKKAQSEGLLVTGWPGHTLEDYFLGLGLGLDAICSDIPVQVQEYIERKN